MKVKVMFRKFECREDIHYKTQTGTSCEKMQLQGLPAGNRTRVLWITRPVLYHWATEAVGTLPTTWARVQYNLYLFISMWQEQHSSYNTLSYSLPSVLPLQIGSLVICIRHASKNLEMVIQDNLNLHALSRSKYRKT